MELNVGERLVLLDILPKEGNFLTLKILRKMREDLSFDEEELKLFGIEQKDNVVNWDDTMGKPKEIEIGEKATEIIAEALTTLNNQNRLKDQHFELYERFVEK